MTMLKNTWYAAAWADEVVHGKLLGRMFLSEPVVLFRKIDGTPVALSDQCPHRFAPLRRGPVRLPRAGVWGRWTLREKPARQASAAGR
jgi:phenylpropionate dioxygenase-like ring-hydroxylating dioxygenase large terminal subunit